MTTRTTISFTVADGNLTLGTSRVFEMPADGMDPYLKRHDPVVWAAIQEFRQNGTASGVITISAE